MNFIVLSEQGLALVSCCEKVNSNLNFNSLAEAYLDIILEMLPTCQ